MFCYCLLLQTTLCPTGKPISDSGNNAQEKPALGNWMKKYRVAEIPPYCQQKESTDIKDVDRETEESKESPFEEKIILSGERKSAQVMDCFSSLDAKANGQEGKEGTDSLQN